MGKDSRDSIFWGAVILIIGVLFLLRNLGWHIDIWHLAGRYWPLILVLIGLKNIFSYMKNRQ